MMRTTVPTNALRVRIMRNSGTYNANSGMDNANSGLIMRIAVGYSNSLSGEPTGGAVPSVCPAVGPVPHSAKRTALQVPSHRCRTVWALSTCLARGCVRFLDEVGSYIRQLYRAIQICIFTPVFGSDALFERAGIFPKQRKPKQSVCERPKRCKPSHQASCARSGHYKQRMQNTRTATEQFPLNGHCMPLISCEIIAVQGPNLPVAAGLVPSSQPRRPRP
jgi:hypothetical protein